MTLTPPTEVSPLVLTGGTLVGATSRPLISGTQTWNNAGLTATGILFNFTDTSSNAASLLIDIRANNITALSVSKAGGAVIGRGAGSSGSLGVSNSSGGVTAQMNGTVGSLLISSGSTFSWDSAAQLSGSGDLILRRDTIATLGLGAAAAASPVAQTLVSQASRAGTDTNTGGAALTLRAGLGTGTGTPSNLVLQGIVGTTTGTGTQSAVTALTVVGVVTGQLPGVVVGSAAIATNASDGFLYIPTCAGTPTGTPTTFTGRIPMVYDTSAHQFWFYDSGWKQPKTPAAAAIITWQ